MPLPRVSNSPNPVIQALRKIHNEALQVLSFDHIDLGNSVTAQITPPIAPNWATVRGMFDGDFTRAKTQLIALQAFTLVFSKPIYLDWTSIRTTAALGITMSATYVDGVVEPLVQTSVGLFTTFAPPTQQRPVYSVTFTCGAVLQQIFQLEMLFSLVAMPVTLVPGAVPINVTIVGSLNNFYSNEGINAIPAGLLGVTVVFGFNSQAFIFMNESAVTLEISEDAGVTWERVTAGSDVTFDAKQRANVVIRDPGAAGGQAYGLYVW